MSMKSTFLRVLLAATLVLVSAGGSATAQSDVDERARVHFTSGRAYFDSGDYQRALQEFQQAYGLSQREELHYNLFLCQERIGNVAEAIRELEAFLATNPPDRALLEPRLVALRARQEREAAEQAALEQERLETQRRAEEAEARAREAEERARRAAEAAEGTEAGEAPPGVHPAAYVGYGVGAAGLVTFAVAGILVVTGDGDLSRGCLGAGTCSESALDRQDRRALVADIGLGVGIAGAVTGLVIHLVTRPGSPDEGDDGAATSDEGAQASRARVTPWVGRGVAGAALSGSF